jgi:type II secretion system protein L
MSTLFIRCPLKPFAGMFTGLASEWEDLALAERFEWCLAQDEHSISATQSGVGSIETMPYADEVLVLLPTLDVRLITSKVPLANAKKVQAILPTLLEEHLLSGVESMHITVLPPTPGQPALERTLAAIDRTWLTWLTKQLGGLLSHRVRLIPDCLILPLPDAPRADTPAVMSVREGDAVVYCQRTGLQQGVAWAQHELHASKDAQSSSSEVAGAVPFAWDWAVVSAQRFLAENANSKAPNYALNLLPAPLKRSAATHSRADANAIASAQAWTDRLTWQPGLRWIAIGVAAIAVGFSTHLAWLGIANWRWAQQMELLATQALSPVNVAHLNSKQGSAALDTGILPVLLEQVRQTQHAQGLALDSDFASMAARIHQLISALGVPSVQQLQYSPQRVEFEFKAGAKDYSGEDGVHQVMSTARHLGFMVKHLGGNRYQLDAFAGLGEVR